MGKYQKPPYYGTLKEAGRDEDLRLAGEDRSPKKWVEAGTNYGSWRLIEVERTQTTCVPKGTTDSIIIITFVNNIQNFIQHPAVRVSFICRGNYWRIIVEDFDVTGQLLIVYSAFV
jgi:hypothetical protein